MPLFSNTFDKGNAVFIINDLGVVRHILDGVLQ